MFNFVAILYKHNQYYYYSFKTMKMKNEKKVPVFLVRDLQKEISQV